MEFELTKELVLLMSGGLVVMNQMMALLRMKAEKWLESKNGGGVYRQVKEMREEIRGLRSDFNLQRVKDEAAAKEVVRILKESYDMLSEWQHAIDAGAFACKISEGDLTAIQWCRRKNLGER